MSVLPVATTVLVVAPPTLQRQGLIATLAAARPDLLVTATADTRALPERLRRDVPALVILDTSLPGLPLGLLVEQVRAGCPDQRILVLGGNRLPFNLSRLIGEMGGGMLLARRATPADLVAAVVRLIGSGELRTADEPASTYARRRPTAEPVSLFNSRELEILHLIAADRSSQEIARQLFISIRTVESHRRILLEKAGTRSMIGLVLQALRGGWLQMA